MPQYTVGLPDGKQMVVEADSEDAALSGAQNWYSQNSSQKPDTSMMGALSQGASDLVTGVGKTVKDYVSPDTGKAIADKGATLASKNYQPASEEFIHPSDGASNHTMGLDWSALPRAAVEQAPGLALDIGGQMLTKRLGPAAQYIANAVTYGARTLGNEAEKRAAARTGDANAEPTAEDKLTGLQSTLAQTALNKIGLSGITNPAKVIGTGAQGVLRAGGNVLKSAAKEGLTNAGQDLISQGFIKKGTDQPIDAQEALGAGVMGAGGGALFSAPHAAKEALTSVRMNDQAGDAHTAMAANRITEHAGGTDTLADPKVAYKATQGAIEDVRREIGDAAKRTSNPSTEASNAIAAAKSGEALTDKQTAAVDAEGNDQLSSLVRQATALSKLTDMGNFDSGEGRFAGGASEFARNNARAAVYGLTGAAALPHMVAQGGVGLDSLSASVPHLAEAAAAGVAGYKGLKLADKALGFASPAKTFAERFGDTSGNVRVPLQLNQSPTGPKVTPQNSLTPAQPWGLIAPKPTPFKPDVLEPGIAKIVEKLQNQKQQQTARAAMPLLRQLASQSKPPAPPEPDTTLQDAITAGKQVVKDRQWADNLRQRFEAEQAANAPQASAAPTMDQTMAATAKLAKGLQKMADLRQKGLGSNQAEAEAAVSPMIQEQGGLDAVMNPMMGKRASELIGAANALKKLRAQPEEEAPTPQPAPAAPAPAMGPKGVDPTGATPLTVADILSRISGEAPKAEAPNAAAVFTLPESPHSFKTPQEAAQAIYNEAVAGGKIIRHAEGFKAGTTRRLAGEEAIYNNISKALSSVAERGAFHKYLAALWGSDSPEVVTQVREHMLAEFPQHAGTINKHLSDQAIKDLWTKPAKKK